MSVAIHASRHIGVVATRIIVLIASACITSIAAQAQATASPAATAGLANPASTHCVKKGGTLTMEKNGKGDQFGVCTFDHNRQCEEWALMRGDCRAGGLRIKGFVTPASRYCAITGGAYKVKSASNTPNEQGTCSFKDSKTCDASGYFDGTCIRRVVKPARVTADKDIRATFRCADGKSINANFINGDNSSVKLALSDGRMLDLPQARSGSGARYANATEAIVFWNKGNTAFIEEGGKTTFGGCRT